MKNREKKVVYIYQGTKHSVNREWAESINAIPISTYASGTQQANPNWKRALRGILTIFSFFKIPKDTDALFVEEGLGILPAYLFLKLRKNKKGVVLLSGQLPYYLNDPNKGILYRLRRFIWKMISYFDGVILKSPITYELTKIDENKKEMVYSHIGDESLFNIKNHERSIISIGRVDYRKGIDLMLKAFKLVREDFPETKYYVVGKGELPEEVPGVKKIGYTENIGNYLKKSSIMFHLSRADALPLAVFEAMAAGVVPIISDKVGNKSILRNVDSGLIVTDENEAAEKAKSLLKDRKKLNKLSKACIKEVSKLTKEKQIKKFQDAFWEFVE